MNLLLEAVNFCSETKEIWQLVGNILFVFKIVVPILIFIFGAIDLGKAVVASKDDEIKKAAKSLFMRILSGMVIFFIPTIISFAFTLVGSFNGDVKTDYNTCKKCIEKPGSC